MACILVVSDGPAGMRFSCLELCRRLNQAGHEIRFLGKNQDQDIAAANGIDFEALQQNRLTEFRSRDARRGTLQCWRTRSARHAEALQSIGVHDFLSQLDRHQPDLVLLDGEMQEHIVVALARGVPLALLNTFAAIWRSPLNPPLHFNNLPGVGWSGSRLGIALDWLKFRLRKRRRALTHRLRHRGADRIALLRTLAKETGLDLSDHADASQWLIPFVYPRETTLSLHSAAFEFEPPRAPRVHYTGPMILEERLDDVRLGPDRQRLEALLARHRARGTRERTLVFAGFGSFFTVHGRWLQQLAKAIEQRPGWELILSRGGVEGAPVPVEASERVHIFPWLPQGEVLAHADLAVVHGGINTIDECVLAGVPMLVCSGNVLDMPGCTMRVRHHGIGLAADPENDSAGTIGRDLDRLQDDDGFRTRVQGLRQRYEADRDSKVAERVVADLLATRKGQETDSGP